jgi:2-hydroxycyclohexanecarboxyl-CoA dehydrogenase
MPGAEQRVALVTGGAQGVGAAVARRLAAEGARVAVNDLHDTDKLRAVCAEIDGIPAVADMADDGAVQKMVRDIESELGGVDVLVSNAALETMGAFPGQSSSDFWEQVEVNLTGAYSCIRAVVPHMRRRGRGKIVVISSVAGVNGWARAVGYSASKAGLIGLTKSLARELLPDGILLNAIAPGAIDSPQIEVDAEDAGVTLDELRARYAQFTPLGRIATAQEIAGLVTFLAGPDSDAYVGQVLQPNGGIERGGA